MESIYSEAPLLGENFAIRVLQKAERVRKKRRRRRVLAAAFAASAIAISIFSTSRNVPYGTASINTLAPVSTPIPIDGWTESLGAGNESSAMNAFFPDAMPLARFDARYTADSTGVDVAGWVTPVDE